MTVPPLTIATVLRSGGGTYGPEWVSALKRGLNRHMSSPYRAPSSPVQLGTWAFTCLTDSPAVSGGIRLENEWPGWWSKLEVFRPGLFEPSELVLLVDLDTLVLGDLKPLASYAGAFAMLSDFYRPKLAQSGLVLFRPGRITEQLWERWIADPAGHMRRYRGDGEWIRAQVPDADRIQDCFPGQVLSFKVDCAGAPPGPEAALVCGHGQPRFSSPAAGWAHREWRRL